MEREFLRINGKDSVVLGKEEGRGTRQDSAFLGGSAVQWPFSNKIPALQQFMSYKAAQQERPKKIIFDQISSSGLQPISTVDAFETNHKSSHALASQKSFNQDRQGVHQFAMHVYPSQDTDPFGATTHNFNESRTFQAVSHHSIPGPTSGPFFKVHGSANGSSDSSPTVTSFKQGQPLGGGIAVAAPVVGSTVRAFAPRNISKPSAMAAQLTIFYAGSVNVYDNVPLDKAQAIMFYANAGSKVSSNAVDTRALVPISAPTKMAGVDGASTNQVKTQSQNHVPSPCSGLSSPISVTSHAGVQLGISSSNSNDMIGAKITGPLAPIGQHEPPKAISTTLASPTTATLMPRAVPQARKASLTRFLERRKERVSNCIPYALAKKSPESTIISEDMNLSSKSSSVDVALSSIREQSRCLGQSKSTTDCGRAVTIKLEM